MGKKKERNVAKNSSYNKTKRRDDADFEPAIYRKTQVTHESPEPIVTKWGTINKNKGGKDHTEGQREMIATKRQQCWERNNTEKATTEQLKRSEAAAPKSPWSGP